MKVDPRPLFVLHPDEALRERIRLAAGRNYRYQDVNGWADLHRSVEDAPPAALVVVDPYTGANGDQALSPGLRKLLIEFPSTSVFTALEVTPERFDDLRTLGAWGVMQVISLRHDDTIPALRHRFHQARGGHLRALLTHILPPETNGRARSILDSAAEIVAVGGHSQDLARSLGLSRRTLLRWSNRAQLPPPRTLMAWMRMLLAAELLDDPGRTILSVAQVCGYSSDSGLRRVMVKYLGSSPGTLRRNGAFAQASAEFLQLLAATRAPS